MHDVIIIGSGPAALSAAIYTARADLNPLILASGIEPFGALVNTTDVENYPGFDEGIMGPELMDKMQKQAEKFGAKVLYSDVSELVLGSEVGETHKIITDLGETFEAKAVIYATGSANRKLGLEKESELTGYGLSYCAVCDGAFFRGGEVAIVGGGDTAMEEAAFLTKFAEKVYVLVRGPEARASKATLHAAENNEKIEIVYNTTVKEILSEKEGNFPEKVSGIILEEVLVNGFVERGLPLDALFVAIGSDPRTHLVHGKLDFTETGHIQVNGRTSQTNVPGVFAAGDVVDAFYKQAVVAAGSGVVAALDAERYLESLKD